MEVSRLVQDITNSENEVQQRVECLLCRRRQEYKTPLLAIEEEETKQRHMKI